MIERIADRQGGKPVERTRLCPRCQGRKGRTNEGFEFSHARPYRQWRIIGYIRRMIELRPQDREHWKRHVPDGWCPQFCGACERSDLARGDTPQFRPMLTKSEAEQIVARARDDTPPPPTAGEYWQFK
jgi:hypothetical protein